MNYSSLDWIVILYVVIGLLIVLLTGEIILWVLSGGSHKISISEAIQSNQPEGSGFFPIFGQSIVFLFFRPPFLLGTCFWLLVFWIWNHWL